MVTWLSIYSFIRYWGPIFAVCGLLWKGIKSLRSSYKQTKQDVQTWASTLLDNHAAHAQASLSKIEAAQERLVDGQDNTNLLLGKLIDKL